jgi:hypothetical protein
MRKLLKKRGFAPDVLVWFYGAAMSEKGLSARKQGLRRNNRAENLSSTDPMAANAGCYDSNRLGQPNESCPFTLRKFSFM